MDINMTQPLSHHPRSPDLESLGENRDMVPKFPPQAFDVPDINISNSVLITAVSMPSAVNTYVASMYRQPRESPLIQMTLEAENKQPLMTISQSDVSTHLGLQGSTFSNVISSPSRESSEDSSDDSLPLAQLALMKKQATIESPESGKSGKKPKTPKRKKKKDPNEPSKPVSAYALFFRDTQAAIKGHNPNASFGEISKIVASMWDGLDPESKSVYKKKTEVAKKEYLKQLAAYRASLVSQAAVEEGSTLADKAANGNNGMSPPSISQGQQGGMNFMGGSMMLQPTSQSLLNSYGNSHHQPVPHLPIIAPKPMLIPHTMTMIEGCLLSPGRCIRNGCTNSVIDNIGWDNEYCSNNCVVEHCRDVFTAWVAARQTTSSFPVT